MSTHARLSPSGAHRWMACPGSVVLEAAYPDESSVYANEGTLAHALAAGHLDEGWCLEDYVGESWRFEDGTGTVITKEMVDYVHGYCARVREDAEGGMLAVEQRLAIDHITGEPDAYGTSDAVIVKNGELIVIDLKYGMGVKVYAEENEQLYLYAAGALHAYELLYEFDEVTVVVDQPRLGHRDSFTMAVEDLKVFIAAAEGQAECVRAQGDDLDLRPGEKQCRFCRAKATCPALRAEVQDVVTSAAASPGDFSSLIEVDGDIGDNYLSMAMAKVGLVEDWCKAVRAEVLNRLSAGVKVEGFKLVKGKRGARKWVDAAQAEQRMKALRLKQDEMYKREVISPTQAEKLLPAAKYQKLVDLVTQSDGGLSVAPATDPRPEERVAATAEDFRELAST